MLFRSKTWSSITTGVPFKSHDYTLSRKTFHSEDVSGVGKIAHYDQRMTGNSFPTDRRSFCFEERRDINLNTPKGRSHSGPRSRKFTQLKINCFTQEQPTLWAVSLEVGNEMPCSANRMELVLDMMKSGLNPCVGNHLVMHIEQERVEEFRLNDHDRQHLLNMRSVKERSEIEIDCINDTLFGKTGEGGPDSVFWGERTSQVTRTQEELCLRRGGQCNCL
mgnify:CR=1 FL=1